ncbi:MAG: hypothetical protein JSW73_03630 [Candidatus Woesearchaeota archaeon]|nr:MAG: hypothetical protein JSW73_03630 [Candidatus Woesearchaeota archaeon]
MEILQRLVDIIISPFKDPAMLWEVLPLVITVLIIVLYFGRYKNEQLGWNSALTNSLVLLYVGTNLLYYLYLNDSLSIFSEYTLVAIAVALVGLSLAFLNYHHILPKKISFGIASVLPINFLAFLSIVFVHGHLKLDLSSLFAAIILFVIIFSIVKLVQSREEEAIDDIGEVIKI